MKNQYSVSEFITTAWALIQTKLFYGSARLIRRPFYIRGKEHLQFKEGLTTGHNCRLDLSGQGITLFLGKRMEIGDNVHIVAHSKVVIGDYCLLASKIFISDTDHGVYDNSFLGCTPDIFPNDRPLISKEIFIGDRCWIGENAVILSGSSIGNGCIVGANSVVRGAFPENVIIAGNPARIIKVYNQETLQWERL